MYSASSIHRQLCPHSHSASDTFAKRRTRATAKHDGHLELLSGRRTLLLHRWLRAVSCVHGWSTSEEAGKPIRVRRTGREWAQCDWVDTENGDGLWWQPGDRLWSVAMMLLRNYYTKGKCFSKEPSSRPQPLLFSLYFSWKSVKLICTITTNHSLLLTQSDTAWREQAREHTNWLV